MKTVRIGGVPEHFNYAWYIGLKKMHLKLKALIYVGWTVRGELDK